MKPDPRGHYVYFIKPIDSAGPIKIGHSHIPVERLQVHMNWSPVKLELLALTVGNRQDEKALHDRFSGFRSHCEWFWPTPEMLDGIRKVQAGLSLRDAFAPADWFRQETAA